MNGYTAQYQFNFLEFWKSEYQAYDHEMNGTEFFNWCVDKDTLNEFIAIYYDWAMNDFDMKFKPLLSGKGETLKWVGGES